jgi:signal peptidase II
MNKPFHLLYLLRNRENKFFNTIIRILFILLILIVNISCDQLTKNLVRHEMGYNEQISWINHHIILTKVENTGAFLSIFNDLPKSFSLLVLVIIPLLVLGLGFYYVAVNTSLSKLKVIALCLLLGGGFGNVIDRIVFGSVTDFMHVDFVVFRTGIFNFADLSIMCGMFIFIVESYITRTKMIDTKFS